MVKLEIDQRQKIGEKSKIRLQLRNIKIEPKRDKKVQLERRPKKSKKNMEKSTPEKKKSCKISVKKVK